MHELLKYLILGIVQGVAEPLPISSSGHMVIFENLLGLSIDNMILEIVANTGSLIAIIFFYFAVIKDLLIHTYYYIFKKAEEYKKDFQYCLLIIVATIPAGIAGIFLKDVISKELFMVGIGLIITAISLLVISKFINKNNSDEVHAKNAFLMGFFQIIGLFPGISRSGATTVGGIVTKLKVKAALQFSFLMYIPISFGALLFSIKDMIDNTNSVNLLGCFIAFIASLVTTYLSIKILHKIVEKRKYHYFAFYCLPLGIIVLIWGLLI